MSNTYKQDREAFIIELIGNKNLHGDIVLFLGIKKLGTGGHLIPTRIQVALNKYNLDIGELDDLLKEANARTQSSPKTVEQALIEHKAGTAPELITDFKKHVFISEAENITGVWRLVATTVDSHVYAVRWDRQDKGRSGNGVLFVAFATGGDMRAGSLPVYQYQPVSYDNYYDIWKRRVGSVGSYVNRILVNKTNYRPSGRISTGEVLADESK